MQSMSRPYRTLRLPHTISAGTTSAMWSPKSSRKKTAPYCRVEQTHETGSRTINHTSEETNQTRVIGTWRVWNQNATEGYETSRSMLWTQMCKYSSRAQLGFRYVSKVPYQNSYTTVLPEKTGERRENKTKQNMIVDDGDDGKWWLM